MPASKERSTLCCLFPTHAEVFPLQYCLSENANPGVWAFAGDGPTISPTSSTRSEARGVKTMVPLSFNVAQLEVLVVIAGLLFFAFLFLAIFFSAIIGVVTARMLYVGGHWCVKKIQQSHSACNTRTV